jgi:hypothetical protein
MVPVVTMGMDRQDLSIVSLLLHTFHVKKTHEINTVAKGSLLGEYPHLSQESKQDHLTVTF